VGVNNLTRCFIDLAERDPEISGLWLYGSRARGDQHLASDYDLAVSYYTCRVDRLGGRLRPALLAMAWRDVSGGEVSIVDIDNVPPPLAVSIIDEGLLLLDKTPKETAWLYQKIWSKWDDWQYQKAGV